MSTAASLAEYDIAQAFRLIDARRATLAEPDQGPLLSFRRRLAGELVFDAEEIAATLAPNFELVTRAGGTTTVTSCAAMLRGIAGQGELGGAVMWVEFEDLLVDHAIGGHGVLRTASSGAAAAARGHHDVGSNDICVTSFPVAFFVTFDGALMASEVLHMDAAATETTMLRNDAIPSIAQLVDLAKHPVVP